MPPVSRAGMTGTLARYSFFLLSTVLCPMFGGCWSSANTEPTGAAAPAPGLPAAPEVPVVVQTPAQIREEMMPLDPFSQEFDDARLKLLVLLDKDRKAHGVEGFVQRESPPVATYSSPTVYADPETGRVAWRALACWNPSCTAKGRDGGPFLFTREFSWITVGADGQIVVGSPNMEEMMRPVYCPACKSKSYIQPYEFPESAVRRKALAAELNRVYSAYAAAAKSGHEKPASMRTPDAIVKEIESLPKLYLLSEAEKVKLFDAVTAPVSGGLGGAPK